jgi:tripartite-type tricarboxylate transporter receptor subunit TctC
MTEHWGQQIVVDLGPGASGIIGAEIAMRTATSGYTLTIKNVAARSAKVPRDAGAKTH